VFYFTLNKSLKLDGLWRLEKEIMFVDDICSSSRSLYSVSWQWCDINQNSTSNS